MTLMRPRYGAPMLPTLHEAIDRLFDESVVRPGEWLTLGVDGKFALPWTHTPRRTISWSRPRCQV